MPVTTFPSPEKAGQNGDPSVKSDAELFAATSKTWTVDMSPDELQWIQTNKKVGKEDRRVLRKSFNDVLEGNVIPYTNGFVKGLIRAFNQDVHLVLRPDDLWLAIMTQFGMYINGHAEEMRSYFVEHEDKKKVTVDVQPASLADVDLGTVAQRFAEKAQEYIVDPELKEWMIPQFTTTTPNDTAVASFAMLGALQRYFEYEMLCGCGFPSVTLLGEKADWEAIASRISKLERYGEEVAEWSRLLQPIANYMVRTFDEPESEEVKHFWLRVCYEAGADGSGCCATISGWITAFFVWNEEGKRTFTFSDDHLLKESYFSHIPVEDRRRLVLDGVSYPIMSPTAIPSALISVPITVQDFGSAKKYQTTVMAGHVGVTATTDGSTVQPLSGWWMLEDSAESM